MNCAKSSEAISYTILPMPHEECRKLVGEMTRERRVEIIGEQMRSLGDHDPAIREFEMASMTFELVMDYGAYREFRRHRMQSCFPQPMTVGMGYRTPDLIVEAGLEEKFRQAMKTAEDGYGRIMEVCPRACQYLVTHAHLRSLIVHMNLREAYHLFKLRTSQQAHESIRGPVLEAMRLAVEAHPELFQWLRLRDYPDWWPHPRE